MKILKLECENIKRLVAVQITPDGHVVELTGKNGAGKTSILDSIWWAVAGAGHIQACPIRKGEKKARIRLDLGEVIVTRQFKQLEDGSYDTTVAVEQANGARFNSPQKMLDSFLGALSFDPLEFSRLSPGEQFGALKKFVPDVDFAKIDAENKADYSSRAEWNRKAKDARSSAQSIALPDVLPESPIDESKLVAELEEVGAKNAELEQLRAARQGTLDRIERDRKEAKSRLAEAEEFDRRAAEMKKKADELRSLEEGLRSDADKTEAEIQKLPPFPDKADTASIRTRIGEARKTNELLKRRDTRNDLNRKADEAEQKAKEFTVRMNKRTADQQAAIAAASMPVDGLGFGDGEVTMNGVPFAQASTAEQLRTSIAIAMAGNPKLKVICIRDGSLLDSDGMKIVAEMAEKNDYQVWIERVADGSRVGFEIADGQVVTRPASKVESEKAKPAVAQEAAA